MDRTKLRVFISLALNTATIVLTTVSVAHFFIDSGDGNMAVAGFTCFRYFTVLSNVFAALTCIAVLAVQARSLVCGGELPRSVMLLKYSGTVAVTVTLAVVLVFLGPTMGYDIMFVGYSLYLHMICPLLALASFCFLEKGGAVEKREFLVGDVSVIIYGTLYLFTVVVFRVWPDFYGFNRGGLWYISYPAMLVGGYLVSMAVAGVHNAILRKAPAGR